MEKQKYYEKIADTIIKNLNKRQMEGYYCENKEIALQKTGLIYAITLDGELVNIDGRGNRLAFLCYGLQNVIILTGMNKVVSTIEEGFNRTRNIAAPPNAIRLNKKTPCAITGKM